MPIAEGNNPNLEILETTVDLLGPLAADMVFVGGCATGLLIKRSRSAAYPCYPRCRRHRRGRVAA